MEATAWFTSPAETLQLALAWLDARSTILPHVELRTDPLMAKISVVLCYKTCKGIDARGPGVKKKHCYCTLAETAHIDNL